MNKLKQFLVGFVLGGVLVTALILRGLLVLLSLPFYPLVWASERFIAWDERREARKLERAAIKRKEYEGLRTPPVKAIAAVWAFALLLGLIFGPRAQAAIQYAGGTNKNTQCTATAGTKQELSDCVEDTLVLAGWTVISGSHTTNVLLESAVTPAGLQMRLNLTQGTNCLILKGRNVANTRAAATGQFLLPAVGKVFRVIADKYQGFVSTDGTPVARSTAAFGVLYVPSFTATTEAIWTTGNAASDTDTNLNPSWKLCLALTASTLCGNANSNTPSTWVTLNGAQWESTTAAASGQIGFLSLVAPLATMLNYSTFPTFYRWTDNSAFITEPLVGWGSAVASEGKVVGQFWDAAIITDSVASETSLTFDSHNWLSWTNNNVGIQSTHPRGTLVLVVP